MQLEVPGDRHVVPPKSSQLQCEQHGLFDEAMGSLRSDGTAATLQRYIDGTLAS